MSGRLQVRVKATQRACVTLSRQVVRLIEKAHFELLLFLLVTVLVAADIALIVAFAYGV